MENVENVYINNGISYKYPEVILLEDNSIGHTEYAGRVVYNSFENSEK